MQIGIAYDLKADFAHLAEPAVVGANAPDDKFEEYDSVATIDAIETALRARGHDVRRLGGGRNFVAAVLEAPPQLVFNISEGRGTRSREAHVPAVCEMLGIPYTHSDPLTSALSLDKAAAKRIVRSCGVATPDFVVVEKPEQISGLELPYPLFAKPLFEGSSMGIRKRSRIANPQELRERVATLLADYGEPVLVEEYCSGAEFTVGILGTGAGARVISAMEIVPKLVAREDFVYSLEVKRNWNWSQEVGYDVPPKRPPHEIARIEKTALDAYRALECRDVARVDLRCSHDGTPKFIEANPLPGIAPGWSDLSLLWNGLGRTYEQLIHAILDAACERLGL
jgi:D-alanine-D-alanine ligase